MAKRLSDTDKWKKPFIRGLEGAYKLLWLYILDDCDHAGIWQVDFEVACIRIGEDVKSEKALKEFGDKIQVLNGGTKWFIKDFIEFQYGELKENNRLHVSVLNLLEKNKVGATKPLARGQEQEKGYGQEKGQKKGTKAEIEKLIFEDEIFMGDISSLHKGKDLKVAFEQCWIYFSQRPQQPMDWEWKQKFSSWLISYKEPVKQKKGGFVQ